MSILKKTSVMNRIHALSELEKYIERKESLMGGKYKNVNDLLIANKRNCFFFY
jgi:hypothetical protein